MRRYQPGHSPDYARPDERLQACSCGYVAATLDAVKQHAWAPEPEPPALVFALEPARPTRLHERPAPVPWRHRWVCSVCNREHVNVCLPCQTTGGLVAA